MPVRCVCQVVRRRGDRSRIGGNTVRAVELFIGVLVGLALLAGVVVVVRGRRSDGEVCMVCREPFLDGDTFVALREPQARELLGAPPPARARGPVDPEGNPRWLGHVGCVRGAQRVVCLFCEKGILHGDQVAGLRKDHARQLLDAEPPERAATTDPTGRPCFVAHLECATDAGADLPAQ